jgi:UDP-N-acetylmuramoylalanine--D-glutamate ligase
MQDWRGKRVLVIGAARQGKALSSYLARHGASVILNDQRPPEALLNEQKTLLQEVQNVSGTIEFVFGGHPVWLINDIDLVCPSGGVPLTLPMLLEARERGLPFSNDSQIFLEAAPCPVIGITGSAGKTTTATIIGRMAAIHLKQKSDNGGRVYTGGNIGDPLINYLDDMNDRDLAVVELSSFQLELMTVSPGIAAVLNITPNHLDRHATMEEYTAAKARILEFQDKNDIAVLNREDPTAWSLVEKVQSRECLHSDCTNPWMIFQVCMLRIIGLQLEKMRENLICFPSSSIGLRGEHNLLNVLAACAVGKAAGFPKEAIQAGIEGFNGVAHRLEFIRHWKGADWYNDSIATAPERSMAAVRSFSEPLILLAGGRDKNLPWQEFACLVNQRVEHLVIFGEARQKIAGAVEAYRADNVHTLDSIVQCAGL